MDTSIQGRVDREKQKRTEERRSAKTVGSRAEDRRVGAGWRSQWAPWDEETNRS